MMRRNEWTQKWTAESGNHLLKFTWQSLHGTIKDMSNDFC